MNSEEVIKQELDSLKLNYQTKINEEMAAIEQKRRGNTNNSSFFGKIKATGNLALEKGQKEIVKRNYPNVMIVPDIPENFLLNLQKIFSNEINPTMVLGIIDTSILHNGTKGFVFTGEKMYMNGNTKETILLDNMEAVEMTKVNVNEDNKELEPSFEDGISIAYNGKKEKKVFRGFPLEPIFRILKTICEKVQLFEESNQRIKQENLSNMGKANFIKIAVNYLLSDDDYIDSEEYASLVSLISENNYDEETFDELRQYRIGDSEIQNTQELIDELMEEVPKGSREAISLNLINSLLILRKNTVANWGEDIFINQVQEYLEISTSKIQFLVNQILNEIKIEKERLSDDKISEIASTSMAAGSAVGIPFAALAATGAITGWGGASGGLLALGLASTGSMIAGITAIGAASFGVYKGVRYLTGSKTTEKYLYRQKKLQLSLVLQQKTTNNLIQDINWLTMKLDNIVNLKDKVINENHTLQEQFDELKNIVKKIKQVSTAAKVSEEKRINDEKELLLTQLPEKLDVNKLEMLGGKNIDWDKEAQFVYNVYELSNEEYLLNKESNVQFYNLALDTLNRIEYDKTSSNIENTMKKSYKKLNDTMRS